MSVSSLFDNALHTVMRDFPLHEHQLYALPRSVKTKLMMSVTKRGIFSERNMASLLHEDIIDVDLSECVVSEKMLHFISLVCTRLRKLSLSSPHGCRHNLTSRAFSSLFTRCNRLTVLNTRCCTLFDDSAVFTLTQTNSFLVSLCLSGCHMITDQSLVAIAHKSKYLKVLDLTKTKITSDGLRAISSGVCGKVLKELNISHCLNVTDDGVQCLVQHCPRLTILVTHSCPQLTHKSRDTLSTLGLKQLTWTVYL
ncbi:protein AMN1 homolog [Halichondria panicea]|uniref:protein AMN1 homolog n=1 Tax=Halichondria panicea TaxID=6063 RepID=UPI00312B976C